MKKDVNQPAFWGDIDKVSNGSCEDLKELVQHFDLRIQPVQTGIGNNRVIFFFQNISDSK